MIAAGSDGALWFTLNQGNAIGRITVDGETALYPLPTEGAGPVGITAGPDGALWFVEIGAGQVGRITVDGEVTEFPLPDREARPHAVTAGPDGRLWFTEWAAGRIGSLTPDGAYAGYELDGGEGGAAPEPHGLAVTPDGTVHAALELGAIARLVG